MAAEARPKDHAACLAALKAHVIYPPASVQPRVTDRDAMRQPNANARKVRDVAASETPEIAALGCVSRYPKYTATRYL